MQAQNLSAYSTETTDLFQTSIVEYAGFWPRFAAALIDGLILMIPNYALIFLMGNSASLFNLIIGWLYFALQESGSNQATIGKKAMGIKVTNLERQRISFGQATGRHFGKIISIIILFIGYLMMLWDEKKQTLHDKMAGTLVIKSI